MSQPAKLLIVDDEKLIRLNLRALLEDLGYLVVEAADGREGLDIFDREHPDLVLADLRMPVMDGLSMIAELREKSPETPVIVISGTGAVRDAVDSLRFGVWDYILKPVADAEGFAIIIERAFEKARLLRENHRYRDHLEEMVRERTEELRESEARFRRIVDTANEGVWVLGPDMETVSFNARMTEMLGFTTDEMVGRPFTDCMFEEDIPHHLLQIEDRRQGIKGQYERRFRHRDGREVWTLASASPLLDEQGRFEGSFAMFTDITERKDAEKRLNEQLHFLRQLLDSIPIPVYYKDVNGLYLGCNSAFEEYIGLSRNLIVGKTVYDVAPKELADIYHESDMASFRNPGAQMYEASVKHADGTIHQVVFNKATYMDADGRTAGLVGAIMDITQRLKAEESLRLNAERMSALLQLNQMTDMTLDEITNFAFEAAVKLTRSRLGYLALMNENETVLTMQLWSRDAMADCRVTGPSKVFPIETTGLWGEAVRQRRPVITNDYNAPNPWKRGTPEGHVRLTRHMNLPVIVGGRIVLVAGVGNKDDDYNEADVNHLTLLMEGMWRLIERKRSLELLHRREQEFRAVVENSPDTISRYDSEGRLIYVNPAMQRLFGLPEKEPPPDYSPSPDAADFMRMVREVLEKGIEFHKDISVRTRQGEFRWYDVRLAPEFDPDGNIASCLAIGRDVTEERKMEKELFRAKRMEIIGQLAGGVAHEVRNPLNAILSISEALFREKEIEGNPEFLPYIRHMRTQVGRLSKLMRDLLDLGKPISSANIQPVSLKDVLTEVISLWGMTEASRTHPLSAAGPDKTRWLVNADSSRLQQALLNLIENAAQQSPAGSEICLRIIENAGPRIAIQVTDLGKGIPPEKLESVFEPFFTTRAGGTGLGLALVKHFVESMGGSVRIINNEPPPGCTAEVTLRQISVKGAVDHETKNTAD